MLDLSAFALVRGLCGAWRLCRCGTRVTVRVGEAGDLGAELALHAAWRWQPLCGHVAWDPFSSSHSPAMTCLLAHLLCISSFSQGWRPASSCGPLSFSWGWGDGWVLEPVFCRLITVAPRHASVLQIGKWVMGSECVCQGSITKYHRLDDLSNRN